LYAAADVAENEQYDDGTYNRADESCMLALGVESDELSQVGRNDGPADADQRRDDDAARVAAGHEELGNQPNYSADDDGPDEVSHGLPSSVLRGPVGASQRPPGICLVEWGRVNQWSRRRGACVAVARLGL